MLCEHQWNFSVYLLSRPRLRSTNPLLFCFVSAWCSRYKERRNKCVPAYVTRWWESNDLPALRNSSELRYIKTRQFGRPFRSSAFSEESAASFLRKIRRLNFNYIITEKMTKFICLFLSVVLMEANCASSVNSYLNPYRFNSYYPWPQWNYPFYFYNQPSARTPRTHYIKS